MYRDDLTAAEARVHELERRLAAAREETARLQQLHAARPNPWAPVAKVWMAASVLMVVLGVVYVREMSRHPQQRALGPHVGRAVTPAGGGL